MCSAGLRMKPLPCSAARQLRQAMPRWQRARETLGTASEGAAAPRQNPRSRSQRLARRLHEVHGTIEAVEPPSRVSGFIRSQPSTSQSRSTARCAAAAPEWSRQRLAHGPRATYRAPRRRRVVSDAFEIVVRVGLKPHLRPRQGRPFGISVVAEMLVRQHAAASLRLSSALRQALVAIL